MQSNIVKCSRGGFLVEVDGEQRACSTMAEAYHHLGTMIGECFKGESIMPPVSYQPFQQYPEKTIRRPSPPIMPSVANPEATLNGLSGHGPEESLETRVRRASSGGLSAMVVGAMVAMSYVLGNWPFGA